MKCPKQPELVCPFFNIGVSAHPMAVFSGFCESRAMRAVYYRCTAMAIKMVSKVDTFASSFCLLLLWLPPEAIRSK
jgi:hypothetical protein